MPVRTRRKPLLKAKASIGTLANDNPSLVRPIPNVGTEVIDRIKKCFAHANHANANEQEAQAASMMASRIMKKYSITQAEVMIHEDRERRANRGGLSTVNVYPAHDAGRPFIPGWTEWLMGAMECFFECRSFSTSHYDKIEYTFYGIAEHTVAAAVNFEAVHNQILDWSEKFMGVSARNSYCLGVTEGLLVLSRQEKKATEEKARKAESKAMASKIREEELEEQKRLARLHTEPMETILESDVEGDGEGIDDDVSMTTSDGGDTQNTGGDSPDDSDETFPEDEVLPDFADEDPKASSTVDPSADFDAELNKFQSSSRKGGKKPWKGKNEEIHQSIEPTNENIDVSEEPLSEWKSMRQLSTFRSMSRDIEEKVLEDSKLKLRAGRKMHVNIRDGDAFKEGQKDSKKINVRAARIEPKNGENGEAGMQRGEKMDLTG